MAKNTDLISLQGELFLAKITNGVVGTYLTVGNMPKLELNIKSDTVDHYESKTGNRAKDAVLYKQTALSMKGTLEEVTKQNLAKVMSGNSIEVASQVLADISLGSVKAGQMINLGYRNLSNVVFKSGSASVDPTKYALDSTFGTVTFLEDITDVVTWSGTAGAVTRTTIANNVGTEYAALFKGVDTYSGDKVVVEIWRLQLSPETTFDLINEKFSSYDISGDALADSTKSNDVELGPFGVIERFSVS